MFGSLGRCPRCNKYKDRCICNAPAVEPSAEKVAVEALDATTFDAMLDRWFGLADCKGVFNRERMLAFANDAIAAPAVLLGMP